MRDSREVRVGVYLRVSTSDQSCEMQRREIDAYVQARGWLTVTYYEDAGFTGTNTNRPQFKQLIADARHRKLDVIVVFKLDRFARSLKDLITHLEELTQLGVDFIALKDAIDFTTASGKLLTSLLGAFAAFEADIIRERVRSGLANARAKGKRLGRPKLRDDAAILSLRAEGKSLRQIMSQLNTSMGAVQRAIRGASNTPPRA